MIELRVTHDSEGIIETMIALARCTMRHRIVVTGTNAAQLMFALHRRGYGRVAVTTYCPLAIGQYDVALVDWRQKPIKALETTLDWLLDFLDPAAVVVVWVDPPGLSADGKIRSILRKRGLTVDGGTVRDRGAAISARRSEARLPSRFS